jgi:hypothetical protein
MQNDSKTISFYLGYHAVVTFVVHTCCEAGVCFLVCWLLSFALCVAVMVVSCSVSVFI